MGSLQQLWYNPICGFERDGLSYFTAPSRILANLARESLRVRIAALAVSKPLMPQGVEHCSKAVSQRQTANRV